MQKICKKCGIAKERACFYRLTGPQYKKEWNCRDSFCIQCRIKYQTERRRKTKKLAIDFLGGKCTDCGLKTEQQEVYDFHHLDSKLKDFSFGKKSKSFNKIEEELRKCILLCSNCHRIRHANEL